MSFTDQPSAANLDDLQSTETVYSLPKEVRPVPPLPKQPMSFEVDDVVRRRRPTSELPTSGADKATAIEHQIGRSNATVPGATGDGAVDLDILKGLQKITSAEDLTDENGVSKSDLALILERFAQVLRGNVDREGRQCNHETEIIQMKSLLLEAQDTIISLLNDRVYDRAKIARLEAEIRLMPDLQLQATRAMGLAMRTDDFEKELGQMKEDLGRLRQTYLRFDQPKDAMPWWRKAMWLRK